MSGGWQAAKRLVSSGVNSMRRNRAIGTTDQNAAAKKHAQLHDVQHEPEEISPKLNVSKRGSVALRLAAQIDALKTELSKSRAKIAALEARVDEDPLTGLLNRRGFVKALERSLAYVRRYGGSAALLFLDLDGFKAINDRHGHAAGDWVLGRTARLLNDHVRASDVVARVSGDEFVVLLWNLRAEQADMKARALEEMIANTPFTQNRNRYMVRVSVGLTMLAADDTSGTALVRADHAMYARKRERRTIQSKL